MTSIESMPDELNMGDIADVEFVKASNNPALWHEAAVACVAHLGDRHGFVPWLIHQPNMDRSTAGWIFLWLQGSNYLSGQRTDFYTRMSDHEVVSLQAALCDRSEKAGFSEDRIGLDSSFETARQACLTIIADGKVASDVTVPNAILNQPFRAPSYCAGYEVHDGLLVNTNLFA